MKIEIVKRVIIQFAKEFVENPYLCYTEHGLHALFYTRLYNSLPTEQRYRTWHGKKVCVIQKEYRTAKDLDKSKRQNWDISIIKTPIRNDIAYDYQRLFAVVEFGMNESETHLSGDIARITHSDANIDHGFIMHLYRLSFPGSYISNRDWSANSKKIVPIDRVAQLSRGMSVEIIYGLYDVTGKHTSGAWLIEDSQISSL